MNIDYNVIKSTNANKLTSRITIQASTDIRDEEGNVIKEWTDVKTVYAKVRAVTTNTQTTSSEIEYQRVYFVTCRFLS